ncbi:MAG: hypothetical protein ACXW4B_11405 [Micavibrio sp.]
MSLNQEFSNATNRGNEQLPGLETGLTNVFQLNAANVPATDIPGARLGLYNLQASETRTIVSGNSDLASRLMDGITITDPQQNVAPAPVRGFNN